MDSFFKKYKFKVLQDSSLEIASDDFVSGFFYFRQGIFYSNGATRDPKHVQIIQIISEHNGAVQGNLQFPGKCLSHISFAGLLEEGLEPIIALHGHIFGKI